jgi:hypothetical protein
LLLRKNYDYKSQASNSVQTKYFSYKGKKLDQNSNIDLTSTSSKADIVFSKSTHIYDPKLKPKTRVSPSKSSKFSESLTN